MSGGVLFRTEADATIGLGHLRRCLTLADALGQLGLQSSFLLNDDRHGRALAEAGGYAVRSAPFMMEPDATLKTAKELCPQAIVGDSYQLGASFYGALVTSSACLVALDDLGADLPVDVLINGAAGAERLAYSPRGPRAERQNLLGAPYALLRNEFARAPERSPAVATDRVLVTTGGTNPQHLTERIVAVLVDEQSIAHVDVVVGPFFQDVAWDENARVAQTAGRLLVHDNPSDIRALMLSAAFAVSGAGQTLYELAATGTPAIAIQTADNQARNVRGFAEAGIALSVGSMAEPGWVTRLRSAVQTLSRDAERRIDMGARARTLVDGRGAERVARAVVDRCRALAC